MQSIRQGLGGFNLVFNRQRAALRLFQQLIKAALFEIFTTLHEVFETAGKGLQNLVHRAALLQQVAGQTQQKAPLAQVQLADKLARHHAVEGFLQQRRLLGIGQQAPESGEGPPGLALGDQIDAGKQRVEHFAPIALAVHDALAQIPIELLELIAHAAKIAGQIVGQRDDLAGPLQRGGARQHAHPALLNPLNIPVDAGLLRAQALDPARLVGVGILGQPGQRLNHQRQAALGSRRVGLGEGGQKTNRLHRSAGEFVFFLAGTRRKAPFEVAVTEPVGHVGLRGLGEIVALGAQHFQIPGQPLEQNRGRQAALLVVELRLKQRNHRRPIGRGEQAPQRLTAHTAVGGDVFMGFHSKL